VRRRAPSPSAAPAAPAAAGVSFTPLIRSLRDATVALRQTHNGARSSAFAAGSRTLIRPVKRVWFYVGMARRVAPFNPAEAPAEPPPGARPAGLPPVSAPGGPPRGPPPEGVRSPPPAAAATRALSCALSSGASALSGVSPRSRFSSHCCGRCLCGRRVHRQGRRLERRLGARLDDRLVLDPAVRRLDRGARPPALLPL
jgi:hypothetical protein